MPSRALFLSSLTFMRSAQLLLSAGNIVALVIASSFSRRDRAFCARSKKLF
jgi:hypothetical protein